MLLTLPHLQISGKYCVVIIACFCCQQDSI
jgi:hypothetical protein